MTKMALVIGTVAIVLVGVLLFAGLHARTGFAHSDGRFVGCAVDRISDKLELDADQKEHLKQIAEALDGKRREMKDRHIAVKEAMLSELKKESIDRTILDAHYKDTMIQIDQMYALLATRLVEFHQTLRPDQKEKLVAEMEKHHQRRCGFHHRWKDAG